MNIIFMGTPDFARESLEKLYNEGHTIGLVVTSPDRQKGRGMKLIPCEVKEFALGNNLRISQPEKISKIKQEIIDINPDLIVVVSYGKFLPKSILSIPKYGCINVHPSLLPKYRGSAPIQWAIINGDDVTGTTIMKMNSKMDAGDIILQKEVQILENETTGELWERLSEISSNLLIEAIEKIENNTANFTKQSEEYTIAPMITKDMAKIDFEKQDANQIKNLVRGLNPFLGAYCKLGEKKIKLWKVEIISTTEYEDKENGEIIMSDEKKGLYIKTKKDIISVLEIQGENSRKMNISDYLRGNKLQKRRKI